MEKTSAASRRGFLSTLGVAVGGAGLAGAGLVGGARVLKAAQEPAKGKIPDTPFKVGHMTFLTSAAAVLGEPSLKGHTMAAEEINAKGGLLGKRKIETITADEAAGTDANVKELRRMKLDAKIDLFTGVISSANTPALGPVAEELRLLTMFTDGCTDFLFDKAVPNPKYVFRITNIQSADGITAAIGVAQTWPQVRKIAHIHPDYSYGRNAAEHFTPGARTAAAGDRDRLGKLAEARHHRLHRAHHQDHVGAARPADSPRSGVAITSPFTSRRCATACSTR